MGHADLKFVTASALPDSSQEWSTATANTASSLSWVAVFTAHGYLLSVRFLGGIGNVVRKIAQDNDMSLLLLMLKMIEDCYWCCMSDRAPEKVIGPNIEPKISHSPPFWLFDMARTPRKRPVGIQRKSNVMSRKSIISGLAWCLNSSYSALLCLCVPFGRQRRLLVTSGCKAIYV